MNQKRSPESHVNCLGIFMYMNKCFHIFHHEAQQIPIMLNADESITVEYFENGSAI
jgi:hypothetical protein